MELYSGKSRNGLITLGNSVRAVLVIDTFPLVVGVVLNIDGSVDDWLETVNKEEHWDSWENNTDPVTRETNIKHSISLKGRPRLPQPLVGWRLGEWLLLLAESWDI